MFGYPILGVLSILLLINVGFCAVQGIIGIIGIISSLVKRKKKSNIKGVDSIPAGVVVEEEG